MRRRSLGDGATSEDESTPVRCPFCGSTDTQLEQRKGTAMCRTMYLCNACSEPFEQFD